MHYKDARSILSSKGGMNPYRGCTHGCIYCDSRSACYGMDHPFEDVEVKRNAPELLEDALRRRRSRCMVGTGSMCDPYLPLERTERITRRCLEIAERYGFGFSVITKSDLVLRDLELLRSVNAQAKCVVQITLTTMDETLCRILEPNVCTTARRIEVLNTLHAAGIPTVVWLSPILPFLNDTEENIQGILDACFSAGVHGILCFGMGVTLREGDRDYFYQKLDEHFPELKQRYIRSFGNQYTCNSPQNAALMKLFHAECERRGVLHTPETVFQYLWTLDDRPDGGQLSLF